MFKGETSRFKINSYNLNKVCERFHVFSSNFEKILNTSNGFNFNYWKLLKLPPLKMVERCWKYFQILNLPWWRSLSYRNHAIDLHSKSVDWFLYERALRAKRVKCALSGLRQFLATGSCLKMINNAYYFTSKALFFLRIFKFLSDFLVM